MSEDTPKRSRRSTRLSISIPIVISGVDSDGNDFSEGVRTLDVNKHGGKISTAHALEAGTEVLIENRILHGAAKAKVIRRDETQSPEGLYYVALELLEPQNIWGITFPPDDWSDELGEETPPARSKPPA